MRNIFGTALVVVLSAVLLPNCAGSANAGMTISVSINASSGCPDGYVYDDCGGDDIDWDNVIILNDNLLGYWVLLPGGHWALRCRAMWYDSGSFEWTFGPWWYDYTVTYGSPINAVGFHVYMHRHYPAWHDRYFVSCQNRYQPRIERHIILNTGRYYRHDEPTVYRHTTMVKAYPGRTVTHPRPLVITRERVLRQPEARNDSKGTESIRQNRPAAPERTTTITKTREIRQPASNRSSSRCERMSSGQTGSRQTGMTRSRTTMREHSNGNSSTSTRTVSRSTSRTTHRGR